MTADQPPTAISLFSGLGGMDLGLHRAGIRTAVCIEQASAPARTLKANSREYPDKSLDWLGSSGYYPWRVINEDIRNVSTDDILSMGEVEIDDVDLVVGGPPCQTFSRSNEGARKGTDSDKGRLFEEFARIVQALNPSAFIFENVRGLSSSNNGDDIEVVERTLRGDRRPSSYDGKLRQYGVRSKVINAADFGVPQTRKRLIIIGLEGGQIPDFPEPTHNESVSASEPDGWNSAGRALSEFNIDSAIEEKGGYENALGGKYGHLLRDIPAGANYQHFSGRRYDNESESYVERADDEKDKKVFDWRSRHWNYLLKQNPNRPAWTIQAKPGTYVGPFHWRSRKLSYLEQMRLMDLPISYGIIGDTRDIQRQIGNSLPPTVAAAVSSNLLEQANINTTPLSSPKSVEVDGGEVQSQNRDQNVQVTADSNPWKLASQCISGIDAGGAIQVLAQGRHIAAALDVAEIVQRGAAGNVTVDFKEEVVTVKGQKREEQSRIHLNLVVS